MCIVKLSSFFVSFQSWRVGRGNASNPSHCQRKLGYNLAGYILGFKPITTNTRDLSTKPLRQKKREKPMVMRGEVWYDVTASALAAWKAVPVLLLPRGLSLNIAQGRPPHFLLLSSSSSSTFRLLCFFFLL